MNINTQLRIGISLLTAIIVIMAIVLGFTVKQVKEAEKTHNAMEVAVKEVFELNILLHDYIINTSKRAKTQWMRKHTTVGNSLAHLDFVRSDENKILLNILDNHQSMDRVFRKLIIYTTEQSTTNGRLKERLVTQLMMKSHEMVNSTSDLLRTSKEKLSHTWNSIFFAVFLSLIVITILMQIASIWIKRSMVKPILQLHEGTKIIGKGDLSHKVGTNTKNELGALSRAFDQMTDNLKQIQKDFIDLFESAPVAYFAVGIDGHIKKANQAAVNFIGYSKAELQKMTFAEIYAEESKIKAKGLYHKFLAGIPFDNEEMVYKTKTGKNVFGLLSVNPIKNKDGQITESRSIVVDISLRKQAEEEKALMQKQIFQTSKLASIGELAAGVGHEINNPLAIINGYLMVLEKDLKEKNIFSDNLRDMFDVQKKSIIRIKDIVDGLRSYARSSSDILELIEVNDTLSETLSFLHIIYNKEGVEVEKKFSNEKMIIAGNKGKLQQAFVNIFSNAKDATEGQAQRKIIIETRKDKDHVILNISDNGHGIEEDKMSQIFDSFFTTKKVGKGTGLGLSIVKNIIENVNGSIGLSSKIGEGTKFTIKIPLSEQYIEDTAPKIIDEPFTKLDGQVLLVDDEPEIRDVLARIFFSWGLDVDQAENGSDALNKIEKKNYNYVITDLTMPEMSGEELIDKLKNVSNFNGKIFVMTGTVADKGELEVDAFITKPFDQQQIYQLLRG